MCLKDWGIITDEDVDEEEGEEEEEETLARL
jgi:hypothetical protein